MFRCCLLALKLLEIVLIVRTRLTTSVHLLHGVILLPSGISGKMTISPDTITIIAMLVLPLLPFMYRCLPHVKYQPLNNAMKPSTVQPSKPLIGYVTACLTMLLALLVAGAVASM